MVIGAIVGATTTAFAAKYLAQMRTADSLGSAAVGGVAGAAIAVAAGVLVRPVLPAGGVRGSVGGEPFDISFSGFGSAPPYARLAR